MFEMPTSIFQSWLPESEPKAVLLIVHGLAEHSGRYINIVNHFVPLGYAVYGMDHLGHGKSDGTRVYVKRFEDYTNMLKIYFDRIRRWQPGKPIFLVGHSMGGLISAVFLLDHQAELTGAVLSGAAVKVSDNITPAILVVGKILSALMPRFGLIGLDAKGVCRDPAVVQAYVSDPLVFKGKTTARLAAEMRKAMQYVSAAATKITLPIMICGKVVQTSWSIRLVLRCCMTWLALPIKRSESMTAFTMRCLMNLTMIRCCETSKYG